MAFLKKPRLGGGVPGQKNRQTHLGDVQTIQRDVFWLLGLLKLGNDQVSPEGKVPWFNLFWLNTCQVKRPFGGLDLHEGTSSSCCQLESE